MTRRLSLLVLLAAAPAFAAPQASAPRPASTAAPTPSPEEETTPDSPRASLGEYLQLTRQGKYAEAARYLELPPAMESRGAELARRLRAVLDSRVWLDAEKLPAKAEGTAVEIARIPDPAGMMRPVRLVKHETPEGAHWVFSRSTVAQVDAWYERLKGRWLREHLPEPLLRPGPRDLLWWQWLALPLFVAIAAAVTYPLRRVAQMILIRIAARTPSSWDDELAQRAGGPLHVAWTLLALTFLVRWLDLYPPAETFVTAMLETGFWIDLFWLALRAIDVTEQGLTRSHWAFERPAARALLPLGSRVTKVLLVALGFVALLAALGYPAASLLAGLGIGGLAVALAAQKTVEHLFGSFSIGVDQPFRQGDLIKVEDVLGTVETIGLRSTRIRTLDRTLVTFPNGKLADMKIESLTQRDRLRLATTLALVYETTAAQLREVLAGVEGVLRSHPKIWPDVVVVKLKELGEWSLNVEVAAWFQTTDQTTFTEIRQEVLLKFMEVVEKAGTSFARKPA